MKNFEKKETYRANVNFSMDSVLLEPENQLKLKQNDIFKLFEKIKKVLKDYGCKPFLNDQDDLNESPELYLLGKRNMNWKLEDISRGSCCDGSKPQVVCETDLTTNITTCWAECPDKNDLKLKVKFSSISEGISY